VACFTPINFTMFNSEDKSNRPVIDIPQTTTDRLLDAFSLALLIILIVQPITYYSALPDTIPTHFNASGAADSWGSKKSIWLLPGLGLAIYVMLFFLGRKPHQFNYLTKITEENAAFQYRNALYMVRVVRVLVLLLFCLLVWNQIQIALGNGSGLNNGFSMLLVVLLPLSSVYFIWKMGQKQPK
jgi:uncharacterized membrane protein